MPNVQLRYIERASTGDFVSDLQQVASRLILDEYEVEYWDLPELSDAEKESFLQEPSSFMRDYLMESGVPRPLNAVAVERPPDCMSAPGPDEPRPRLVHLKYPPYASTYYVV